MKLNRLKVFPNKNPSFFILIVVVFSIVVNFSLIAGNSEALTISGPDEVQTGSSAQYTAEGCTGLVIWGVTGKGVSISQDGLLTVTPSACGAITVAAKCSADGSIATKVARVKNSGVLVWIGSCYHVYYGYFGWICRDTPAIWDGRYQYACGYRCGPEDCWPDKCITFDGGNCALRSWCEANPGQCWCHDYECSGIYSSITQSPCYVPDSRTICDNCITVSATAMEWRCISCSSSDSDGDGYNACVDCDDSNPNINPGAQEICGDLIDNNCNGQVDEGCCPDEICNGIDDDCDGQIDEGCFGSCRDMCCKPEHPSTSSINMASSNINHTQPLYRTQNSILPLDLTLTYNSLDGDGPLGKGWTHSYNIKLIQGSSAEYTLKQGYGRDIILIQNGSEYRPPSEAYPVLTINPDNTYKLTYRDKTIYNFDTSGKLMSIKDKYTNTITLTYTDNNLTEISDSQNPDRIISLTHLNGKIQTITDPNGNLHTFTYQNGFLTNISTQTPPPDIQTLNWAYTYKPYGYMWTKTDPMNNIVTYVYDENDPSHRLMQTIDPENKTMDFGFNPLNTTSTVTEKDGGIWTYKYDSTTGRLTEKTIPEGYTPKGGTEPQDYVTTYTYETNKHTLTDNRGNITEYTYYENGNLWKLIEKSNTDLNGRTTTYTYTPDNEIQTITDPENHTTTYTYETIDGERIIKIKDPANEETEYRYYTDGRIKHIKNPKNQTTTFTYAYDPVTQTTTETITDFLGAITIRKYDITGNIIESRDPFDIPTKYEYNSLNQLKTIKDYLNNILYTYEYYPDGSLKKVTDANGNWIEYKYNYKGQVTETKDALLNITTYQYGGTGCPSCSGGGDNLIKIIDANLKETRFEYYKNGSRKNHTDPLIHTTTYTYDPPSFMNSLTDPSTAVTTFDKIDLVITKTDPLGKETRYEYDKAGRLWKKKDRKNDEITYGYTPDNVLETITYPDTTVVTFTNDELDRITTMTDSIGTTTYYYEDNLRKLTVTDPNGFIVVHQYDEAGRLKELTYPGNKKAIYGYDNLNRLQTVRIDWLNPAQTTTYHYDPAGRLDWVDNFNGTITDYGYDNANRLTSLINKKSDNSIIASYEYPAPDGIDPVGDRKRVIQIEPLAPVLSEENISYIYNDKKNRLLSAGSNIFTYDDEGQLATGYNSTYTFDYEHRLKTISGAFNAQHFYDAKGNRIKAIRNGVTTKYIYDNNGNLIAEANANNTITKYYIYGDGLLAMVTTSTIGQVYNYHFNPIGSTIAITNQNQNIINKYSYDEFGNILNKVEASSQPFKYVGQYGVMHESNGHYKMGARYYDPKVGRFISEDPLGFGEDIVLVNNVQKNTIPTLRMLLKKGLKKCYLKTIISANLNIYALNNPLTFIDATGQSPKKNKKQGNEYGDLCLSKMISRVNSGTCPDWTDCFVCCLEFLENLPDEATIICTGVCEEGLNLYKKMHPECKCKE